MNKIGIFIFRKDLRLEDNLGLIKLTKECKYIIPIFILDNYQININNHNKYYRSNNAIQFMCESLIDLNIQLNNKLNLYKGNYINVLEIIINKLLHNYDNIIISYNNDFTKYALERDNKINNLIKKFKNINLLNEENDITLVPFNNLIKSNNSAYMVFGAFYKNAIKTKVNNSIKNNFKNYIKLDTIDKISFNINNLDKLYIKNNNLIQHGGRKEALKKIYNNNVYKNYTNKRDLLNFNTYQISAALNFGCISIREFYHIIKHNIEIKKQLYWRDFYITILRYVKNANSYSLFIDSRFNKVKWKNDYKLWKLLTESKTGYLMIDAAMRELIKTGYIGNRIRLILATFWIKYLLIDPLHPKYGSQVGFSYYLVDCNTSQNKLNHQWFTDLDLPGRRFSKKKCNPLTGRMMRIDNEMIKKFDPECEYIKKWLPELKNIPNKELYKWDEIIQKKYKIHYKPIFNWEDQYKKYCDLYKNI
jgi:deoxyribodipyrimidine photo-lyase